MLSPSHTYLTAGDSASIASGNRLIVKGKLTYFGEFGMHYNYGLQLAAREAYEATPTLQILMAYVERENLVRMRPAAIARQLNVSTATVDRHMSKLRKLGIIEPDPVEADKKQAVVCWRICPFLAWRGKNEDLVQYLSTIPSDHVWHNYREPRT